MVFGFLQPNVHCFRYVFGLILLLVVIVVHNTDVESVDQVLY